MTRKYVRYTISVTVDAEEPLDDLNDMEEDWTEDEIHDYILQERWDYLADNVDLGDWDIYVQIIEKDE